MGEILATRHPGLPALTCPCLPYLPSAVVLCRTVRGQPGFPASAPMFIMGISMGGCVAVKACMHAHTEASDPVFSGCILCAPMCSLEKVAKKGLNAYLK